MLPPQRSADERQHPNARRTPAVDEDGRAQGARSGRRPSGVVGTLVGASTGIGTFVGGVAYAVLWNAYASFYGAFGLTPEDVGLSRERLVVPAILAGLVVMGMLAALAIGVWTGYRLVPRTMAVHRPTAVAALTFFVLTVILGVLSIGTYARFSVLDVAAFVVSFAMVAVVIGGYAAMSRWQGVSLADWLFYVAVGVVLAFMYLVLWLEAIARALSAIHVPEEIQWLVFAASGLTPLALMITRLRWLWLVEPGEDNEYRPTPRHPIRVALLIVPVAAVFVAWEIGRIIEWSEAQYAAGVTATELGYRNSNLRWLEPSVRGIQVHLLDPKRDPLRVCGTSPTYAASFIGQTGDGWWVLLRARPETALGYATRVIWLPRSAYSIDLAPMVEQPERSGDAEESQEQSQSDEPVAWWQPACGA